MAVAGPQQDSVVQRLRTVTGGADAIHHAVVDQHDRHLPDRGGVRDVEVEGRRARDPDVVLVVPVRNCSRLGLSPILTAFASLSDVELT